MVHSARPLSELLGDGSLLRPQGRVTLAGDQAAAYTRLLLALLGRSRLNRSFPDRRRLERLLAFLDPAANHFLYDDIEVGTRTGLPTERSITRLQADLGIAEKLCRDEERRTPELGRQPVAPSSPDEALALRSYRYHRALLEQPLQPSFALHSELRRVEPEHGTAFFTTVLDRFDLSEEVFVRYTILLSHTAEGWTRSQVRLEGESLELTRNFQNLVARTTAHDSELAFLLLSEIPSLHIESVERSRVGPLFAAGMDGPARVQELMNRHPGELVLCLPRDCSSLEIDRDSNDDPFALGYREFIGEAARQVVEERRRQLGYSVRRQRKLVCTPGIAAELGELVAGGGGACVIYTL